MSAPDRDDDAWLDALAGRPAQGAAAQEGRLLREALRRLPAPALAAPPLEPVVEAARRRGLLRQRSWCPACAARWARWRQHAATPWRWAGAAALAGAVGWLAIGLQAPPEDERQPVLRGPVHGVWQRTATDPLAARDRLAARLQAAGVTVNRYERLGRAGLDADLPRPPPPALAALLAAEGLSPAADGSLRVEYAPE